MHDRTGGPRARESVSRRGLAPMPHAALAEFARCGARTLAPRRAALESARSLLRHASVRAKRVLRAAQDLLARRRLVRRRAIGPLRLR